MQSLSKIFISVSHIGRRDIKSFLFNFSHLCKDVRLFAVNCIVLTMSDAIRTLD